MGNLENVWRNNEQGKVGDEKEPAGVEMILQ